MSHCADTCGSGDTGGGTRAMACCCQVSRPGAGAAVASAGAGGSSLQSPIARRLSGWARAAAGTPPRGVASIARRRRRVMRVRVLPRRVRVHWQELARRVHWQQRAERRGGWCRSRVARAAAPHLGARVHEGVTAAAARRRERAANAGLGGHRVAAGRRRRRRRRCSGARTCGRGGPRAHGRLARHASPRPQRRARRQCGLGSHAGGRRGTRRARGTFFRLRKRIFHFWPAQSTFPNRLLTKRWQPDA